MADRPRRHPDGIGKRLLIAIGYIHLPNRCQRNRPG